MRGGPKGRVVVVGIATWELHLNGCSSLKDKRRVVKSLKDRLHSRFNVSVAETDHYDRWQRAELSCCVVANDRRHAESVLSSADKMVSSDGLARVVDFTTSIL
ncbi:MAG: DUF503 domain-containing protein [Gemmatimonadota bacterium]|nr:MAG: DUF503 domain-containing protein [Gemmatimonadota bacterium]